MTIGHCLIRQWPIVLDAVMVGFWPFSLTVLTMFSSPSVSLLPPPLHSEVNPEKTADKLWRWHACC